MKTLLIACLCLLGTIASAAAPNVIPELKSWIDAPAGGVFTCTDKPVLVLPEGADAALKGYAAKFAAEIGATISTKASDSATIVFNVSKMFGRELGKEGYTLEVTPNKITINAASSLGAFWGTRSLLQVFTSQDKTFPCGTAKDMPTYSVRGFMFDCGRKPFAITTLRQIVEIMSYYKMNDLQLHLSDNYIWLGRYPGVKTAEDVLKIEPSAGSFRLESNVKGLTSTDKSYTKAEFEQLIREAKAVGVNIVPEIDVPGHALAMVRVRPDLMYKGSVGNHKEFERAAMLDLSNPQTLPFTTSIFDEYLGSTFVGDVVHIGTDEYYGDAETYRGYVDKMLRHVISKGKTPRFWGSLRMKQGKTPVVVKGTQMHIWSLDWDRPERAMKDGYDIINILDAFTYAVPNGTGDVGAYRDDINTQHLYNNWNPAIFKRGNLDCSVDPTNPQLLGGAWAMWLDNAFYTDPGLCGRDLLSNIRKNCAAVAQKTWDIAPKRGFQDFMNVLQQNGSPVDLTPPKWELTYKDVRGGTSPAILAKGDESTLYAVSPVNGNVGFEREGAQYTFDYKLPTDKSVTLTFKTGDRKTEILVDGVSVGGTPKRQFWPNSCRYYSLPKPE